MTDLPRPDVRVTSRETDIGKEVDVVISRDGKAKSYAAIHPNSRDEADKKIIEQILGDVVTAEWLPGKKDG